MRDQKIKLTDLHSSHTLGCVGKESILYFNNDPGIDAFIIRGKERVKGNTPPDYNNYLST